jgi:hypothetical protein
METSIGAVRSGMGDEILALRFSEEDLRRTRRYRQQANYRAAKAAELELLLSLQQRLEGQSRWERFDELKAPQFRPTPLATAKATRAPEPKPLGVPGDLDREEGTCGWVVGEGETARLCGHPCANSPKSWRKRAFCQHHSERAYCK